MLHLRLDTRAVEALLTVMLLTIGLGYLSTGNTFDLPHYHGFGQYVEDWLIGLLLILVGIFRWLAVIFTNSNNTLFYYFRMLAAAIGSFYWVAIGWITWTVSDDIIASMFAVASTCAIFELFSFLRVYRDYRHGTVVVVVEKDAL